MAAKYTKTANLVLHAAIDEARRFGVDEVEVEHLFVSLIAEGKKASEILNTYGATVDGARMLAGMPVRREGKIDAKFSNNIKIKLLHANQEAEKRHQPEVSDLHILYALLCSAEIYDRATKFLSNLGLDPFIIRRRTDIALKLSSMDEGEIDSTDYRAEQIAATALQARNQESLMLNQTNQTDRGHPTFETPTNKVTLVEWFSEDSIGLVLAASNHAMKENRVSVGLHDMWYAIIHAPHNKYLELLASSFDLQSMQTVLKELESGQRLESDQTNSAHPADTSDPSSDAGSPFTSHSKKALDLAYAYARRIGSDRVDAFCLLIGILHHAIDKIQTSSVNPTLKLPSVAELRKLFLDVRIQADRRIEEAAEGYSQSPVLCTLRALKVLENAKYEAISWKHEEVKLEHLLAAMAAEAEKSEFSFIQNRQFGFDALREATINRLTAMRAEPGTETRFGTAIKILLMKAQISMQQLNSTAIDLNHLAIAALNSGEPWIAQTLQENKVNLVALERRLRSCVLWQRHQPGYQSQPAYPLSISEMDG